MVAFLTDYQIIKWYKRKARQHKAIPLNAKKLNGLKVLIALQYRRSVMNPFLNRYSGQSLYQCKRKRYFLPKIVLWQQLTPMSEEITGKSTNF